ncbi:MAG: hypothetical protein EBY39_05105 [Flavobacteriia bacterium]|nr:hypothetical protein [Flavobacteriia bacterium]
MVSPEKIKESLISLGYKLADRGSYWQTNAVFRNGDNKTAIQIYKNTGVWKDHVQNSSFSPFKRLVEITLGTNDPNQIKQYIDEEDIGSNYNKVTFSEKLEMEEIYEENCLERLLPHYKFYNDKGISTKNLQNLKGGLATTGKLNKRFVFPIYNEYKQIHGFSGRDMMQSSDRPKWKHVGRKKSWVYPLYVNEKTRKSIEENKSVIFVESIGDMLNLHEYGYENVLVTFGLDISSKLVCSTLSLNAQKIIISLNNDFSSNENRGLNASIKNYLKLLNYYSPDQILICLPNKKDFGEMTEEDFNLWKNKLLSTEPGKQKSFIIEKINEIHKSLPKTLLKNKKIIDNE